MIKVFEEIDGNMYLDILLQEKDMNALQDNEMVELEVGVGRGRLYIGIKYFDELEYEKVQRKR